MAEPVSSRIPPVTSPVSQEKFWLQDPSILFCNDNFTRFYPTSSMNRIETLNALSRFFILLTLILVVFTQNTNYLYLLVGLVIVILIYYGGTESHNINTLKEPFVPTDIYNARPNSDPCRIPSFDNPFMNVTLEDWKTDPTRPPACYSLNPDINNQINDYFYQDQVVDIDDVFGRRPSQRQFYTMPSTTIPNDQTAFANWLYQTPPTCKEDQRFCLRHEDIRFSRFNPIIDRFNDQIVWQRENV